MHIPLEVFSDEDTRDLSNATTKSKVIEKSVALSTTTAERAFRNLQLCVGIYSSVRVAGSRRTVDCDDFASLCDEGILLDKWMTVEKEFGDKFHVRGLIGKLKIALTRIENRPLVLLFVGKISMCCSEVVPWHVLVCNKKSDYNLRRIILTHNKFNRLFSMLTEVPDWLFSPLSLDVFLLRKNTLEEVD